MGSQLPNSGSSFQLPAENIGRDCPYQRGGDGFDPSVRVAVLEKELHHCREEKAVTELTVLYLASLHAKGSFHEPNTGHQEERLAKLTSELTRASEANLVLTAKLENAQALITALLTAGGPFIQSTSASQKSQQQKNSSECVDLIDLGGAGKESTKAKFTSDDTTLLDTSDNDSSGNEDGVHKPMDAGQDDQTEFSSFPDSAYIHHFISKKKDDSALCTSRIKTTVKKSAHDPPYPKNAILSSDERSETSAEPDSDAHSQEYSGSSDSFVTADSKVISEAEPLGKVAPLETSDTQISAVQQRSVVGESAATVKWPEAPIVQDKVEEILPSGKNEPEYAFVKASLGPALVKPLWKASSVFSSEERRKETVERHKRNVGPAEHCYPEFFKYGIRFEPDKDERDVYRTVLITELPTDTTMHQVLEKVAGGAIVDAKLLDTMKVTGSMSALINFLHEHAAMEYQEYAHSHPVMINNQLANVKTLSTPTWPIAANLKAAINDHHHTRCLEVLNFPRQQVSELKLRSDIRVHAQVKGDRVEHINVRKDGVLELHFSSITYAGQGYGMFTSFRLYKGCKTRFVADPCARPVEALDQACNTHDQAGIANNMSEEGIAESSA